MKYITQIEMFSHISSLEKPILFYKISTIPWYTWLWLWMIPTRAYTDGQNVLRYKVFWGKTYIVEFTYRGWGLSDD